MTTTSASALSGARALAVSLPLTLVVAVAALASLAVLSALFLDYPATTFRSPDEHASYIFSKSFGETGKLYYTADYLRDDQEHLLHERGGLTFDGRVVPFNDLGLPVLYGPVYRLTGENLRYIAIPLTLITAAALAKAGGIFLGPRREWLAWLAVLGVVPVIYYLNRPLTNAAPAITFFSVGLYFLVRYFRMAAPQPAAVLPAALCFSLAAFVRYEWVIFESLLLAIVLLHKHGTNTRDIAVGLAVSAAAFAVLFVLPVLVLNKLTYGSPLTFGYSLFHQEYFPDRTPSGGLPWSAVAFVRYVLWPSGGFDLWLAGRSLVFQVCGVAPVLVITGVMGAVTLVRRRGAMSWPMVAYALLGSYFFLYYAASPSWLAGTTTPHLEASIVRYSLPLFAGLFLLVCQGMATINRSDVLLVLASALVVVGLQGALFNIDGNLDYVRAQLRIADEQTRATVVANTEDNAFIYTDIFDKTVGPYRRVATWMGADDALKDGYLKPEEVATSIDRLYPETPVYVYAAYDDIVVPALKPALASKGLSLVGTKTRRLYRVQPLDMRAGEGTR